MAYRRTLDLYPADRNALEHHRDHDPRPYVRERCAAVLKVADGEAAYAVARAGLLQPRDPDTVYGWLTRFDLDGVPGLVHHQHGGNRRRSL